MSLINSHKRSAAENGSSNSNNKTLRLVNKNRASIDASRDTSTTHTTTHIPSLQQLSASAVQKFILLQRKRIPKEVAKITRAQRSMIHKQLRQLQKEKKTVMAERMAKLECDIEEYNQQHEQIQLERERQWRQQSQQARHVSSSSSDSSTGGDCIVYSHGSPSVPSEAILVEESTTAYCILSERRKILRDVERYIKERRIKLTQRLKELQKHKRLLFKQRLETFGTTTQTIAMMHLKEIPNAPDLFCGKCNLFYHTPDCTYINESGNPCGWCTICPNCFGNQEDVKGCRFSIPVLAAPGPIPIRKFGSLGFIDRGTVHRSDWDGSCSEYFVSEEQQDWPSPQGYVICWLCEQRYCNQSFEFHYPACRKQYSNRCGFRRLNKYHCRLQPCKVTPGHCGKPIAVDTRSDGGSCDTDTKIPDTTDTTVTTDRGTAQLSNCCRWCTTLYCKDCAPKCKCWDAHCSACVSEICHRSTNASQKNHHPNHNR